jgi:HTH-type transcriptional regulator, competence development regulator
MHTGNFPRVSAGLLTPFGIELRKLRVENRKRIFDLADDLDVSSSSISAWETGRRDVPPEKVDRIGELFKLTNEELHKLKEAATVSRRRIIIEANSTEAREFANAVKLRVNSLSPDTLRELLRYFRSSTTFVNVRLFDRRVRGRSREEIAELAQVFREGLGLQSHDRFDVVDFYDFKLAKIFAERLGDDIIENIRFEVWDDPEMPPLTAGMASMFPPHIVISNSVYEEAASNGDRGRWIMAHELGHLLLLHGIDDMKSGMLMRGPEYLVDHLDDSGHSLSFRPPAALPKKIPFKYSAEGQADEFAAEFLMPAKGCANLLPHQISARFGVSKSNAAKRLKFLAPF